MGPATSDTATLANLHMAPILASLQLHATPRCLCPKLVQRAGV